MQAGFPLSQAIGTIEHLNLFWPDYVLHSENSQNSMAVHCAVKCRAPIRVRTSCPLCILYFDKEFMGQDKVLFSRTSFIYLEGKTLIVLERKYGCSKKLR